MPLYPIRPAHLPQDAERILEVFAAAKGIMVADGNTKQWVNGDERLDYQRMNVRKLSAHAAAIAAVTPQPPVGWGEGADTIRPVLRTGMAARSKSGKRDGARWGSCAAGPRRAALKRNGIIHNASFFTRCKGITPK